jgi:hypothetical protein
MDPDAIAAQSDPTTLQDDEDSEKSNDARTAATGPRT